MEKLLPFSRRRFLDVVPKVFLSLAPGARFAHQPVTPLNPEVSQAKAPEMLDPIQLLSLDELIEKHCVEAINRWGNA